METEEGNEKNDRIVNEAMERNGMQMIEVLMARLNNLSSKVNERQTACIQDRNPDSDFCSSLVQGLQQELSDDENDDTSISGGNGPSGNSKEGKDRKGSIFKPKASSKEIGIPGNSRKSTPPNGALAHGEIYVTFRGEPSTDFGKKLEHKFDQDSEAAERKNHLIISDPGGHRGKRRASIGLRLKFEQEKVDKVKALRSKYEKKLLDNLEAFVSRSATDLVYVMPINATKKIGGLGATSPFKPPCGVTLPKSALSGQKNEESRHDAILRASSPTNMSRGTTPLTEAKHTNKNQNRASLVAGVLGIGPSGTLSQGNSANGTGGGLKSVWNIGGPKTSTTGKTRSNSIVPYGEDLPENPSETNQGKQRVASPPDQDSASFLDEQMLDAEEWPIPLVTAEFNPSLLFGLSCTKVTLPAGDNLMRTFAKTDLSNWLLIYMFWFIHCKSFQSDSIEEQEHLLRRSSAIYVQMLTMKDTSLSRHKDFIFIHYPYLLANSIINGFHYLCPGSRHLYTHAWKRIVYLQCCKVLTGLPDICPISVLTHRNQLFLDDAREEAAFMNKEMNRALVVAAATGVSLPMNAGQVDDILPPLAGQANKDKSKNGQGGQGDGEGGQNQGNGDGQDQDGNSLSVDVGVTKETKSAVETGLPAPLLSNPSEFNIEHIHNNVKLLGMHESTDSIHSDEGHGGNTSPTTRKQRQRLKNRPNKYKFKNKANGFEHHHMEEDDNLIASRVQKGNNGLKLDINDDDKNQHIDKSHRDKEYWKERRVNSLQPLLELTGTRKSLRFNPDIPQEFKTIKNYINNFALDEEALLSRKARTEPLARQRKVKFDQSGVSPMVQQYLEHPDPYIKGGRRPERMGRTHPVKWCVTGTSDTFVKSESRKEIHDSISDQHKAALEIYRNQERKQRKELKENLRQLEEQRKQVYRGGAVSVGKYSLQLVSEISGRSNEGARKRDEKTKEKERERLASEKERQKKAIEEQYAMSRS